MSDIRYRIGAVSALLLVALSASAAEAVINPISVNLGTASLPLVQPGGQANYFAQKQQQLPPVCAGCSVSWQLLTPSKEGSAGQGYYVFATGIDGVLLRVELPKQSVTPARSAASPAPPDSITFRLQRADNKPVQAGTFSLGSAVLQRVMTNKQGEKVQEDRFMPEGTVIIPTCEFAPESASVTIELPAVTSQQLQSAGIGKPVNGSSRSTPLKLRCATQTTGDFKLSFTTSDRGTANRLLNVRNNGVGFLVSTTSNPADAVNWNGTAVNMHSMSSAGAQIPLTAWYSWNGGEITEGAVSAQGLVTLSYQ